MKTAHWSTVTKAIATRYGVSWREAKTVWDKLREDKERKPSLRMVKALPKELPKKLKPVKPPVSKNPAKETRKERNRREVEQIAGKAGAKLAPPPKERPEVLAEPVPARQRGRNRFEKMLGEYGLPIAAIARGGAGKEIVDLWRRPALQDKIVRTLAEAYKQVSRKTLLKRKVEERTKDKFEKLMLEVTGGNMERARILWHAILKSIYGRTVKG